VRFILVLVMLFNICLIEHANSETINRVVAYVGNIAITLDDFKEELSKLREKMPDIKSEEVINILINKTILLKKARELFMEGRDEDIINSYIDLKIKSSIIIPENQVRQFYDENREKMNDRPYAAVRSEIEKYLFERELNKRLKEHIEEIKKDEDIKVIFMP